MIKNVIKVAVAGLGERSCCVMDNLRRVAGDGVRVDAVGR